MEYVLEVLSSLFLYHWLELRIEVAVLVVFYQSGFTLSGELRHGESGRGGEGERGWKDKEGDNLLYFKPQFQYANFTHFCEQSEGGSIRWERRER